MCVAVKCTSCSSYCRYLITHALMFSCRSSCVGSDVHHVLLWALHHESAVPTSSLFGKLIITPWRLDDEVGKSGRSCEITCHIEHAVSRSTHMTKLKSCKRKMHTESGHHLLLFITLVLKCFERLQHRLITNASCGGPKASWLW